MEKMTQEALGRLPVGSRDDAAVLAGIISRRDVLGAHQRAVPGRGR